MRYKIAIGIPTIGRAPVLRDTLLELTRQTRLADRVIVCATKPADVEGSDAINQPPQILFCEPGLTRQRNMILEAASDADILIFFDDDFIPDLNYLEEVERHMQEDQQIVVVTGLVLADGIGGPGLTVAEGRRLIERAGPGVRKTTTVFSGYGCNMAVRVGPMRENNILFDERLPLYGWQEDVDLSRRLGAMGGIVQLDSARGVHLGVKLGRSSGVKLGYSQVANPLYLVQKRSGYPFTKALKHVFRNITMNIVRWTWPEPYVDRRGRLRGNILALTDLVAGRMIPERILEL